MTQSPDAPAPAPARIRIFDALRGYCALWVVVIHVGKLIEVPRVLPMQMLWTGDTPVDIFFILSGFVITGLLEQRSESYGIFLFRRYLRLAPVLIVLCLLYLWQHPLMLAVLATLNPKNFEVTSAQAMFTSSLEHWRLHLPLHVSLFYGLFDKVVPYSSKAFIPPAWSITVEWQYYMLAPLFASCFRSARGALLLVPLLVLHKLWPHAFILPSYFHIFAIGVASYYVLRARPTLDAAASSLALSVAVVAWLADAYACALWALFVLCAYGRVPAVVTRVFGAVFDNPLGDFLGRISYSVYLSHMLVLYLCLHALFPSPALGHPLALFARLLPLVVLGTVALSTLLYYAIEKPGIDFSKAVAARWARGQR